MNYTRIEVERWFAIFSILGSLLAIGFHFIFRPTDLGGLLYLGFASTSLILIDSVMTKGRAEWPKNMVLPRIVALSIIAAPLICLAINLYCHLSGVNTSVLNGNLIVSGLLCGKAIVLIVEKFKEKWLD